MEGVNYNTENKDNYVLLFMNFQVVFWVLDCLILCEMFFCLYMLFEFDKSYKNFTRIFMISCATIQKFKMNLVDLN